MLPDEKFNFLSKISKAIAGQFGQNCEVVIHRINEDNINNTVISIENGHVSSRQVGDGPSQIVLEALKKQAGSLNDHVNYFTRTHDGKILKSSTVYFKDEEGKVEYIFAINYDISALAAASETISSFISIHDDEDKDREPDYIPQNINELTA